MAGELIIGSATTPFPKKATILLHGEQSSEAITYTGAVEAGNKVISNVGTIKMYGEKRSRWSRLAASVYKDDKTIVVESGLDWKAGDEIFLAATEHRYES